MPIVNCTIHKLDLFPYFEYWISSIFNTKHIRIPNVLKFGLPMVGFGMIGNTNIMATILFRMKQHLKTKCHLENWTESYHWNSEHVLYSSPQCIQILTHCILIFCSFLNWKKLVTATQEVTAQSWLEKCLEKFSSATPVKERAAILEMIWRWELNVTCKLFSNCFKFWLDLDKYCTGCFNISWRIWIIDLSNIQDIGTWMLLRYVCYLDHKRNNLFHP